MLKSLRNLHGIVLTMLDHNIMINEFKFQLYYYILFQTNAFVTSMNSLYLPAMG